MFKKKKETVSATMSTDREKLPFWFAPAWSSRSVSLGVNVVLIGYLTYYCTDVLGMNPALVGILLLASKVFDGVTDLMAGFIVDKTHTRLGKGRPYEICIIFVWIFTVMVFSAPNVGTNAQAVYIFIMYTLINSICATFLNSTDAVYLARAVKSSENQVKVVSINGILVMAAAVAFSIAMPQLVAGIGTTKAGWTTIALMFAVPLGIIGILRFLLVKEVVVDESLPEEKDTNKPQITFKESIKTIAGNRYIFIIAGALLIVSIINNLGTATTYYFKYIVGNIGLQSLVSITGIFTPFLLIFYPFATRKLGNTKMLRYGTLLGLAGIIIRTLGKTNLITNIIGSVAVSTGIMPIAMMVNVYLIECMDYGEWKTGKRIEGALTSITSFSSKLGSALASALTGFVMGIAGYNGDLAVQSDMANFSIIAIYNYLPLVLFVIMFGLTMIYNLDKKLPWIREELKNGRGIKNGTI